MKFTASRLSEGNKIFPAEIIIEQNGLTVKIPGLFSGHSKHLDYQNIGEVSVDAPMVGYSTITFYTAGTRVSAHGFTSSEVKQIKQAIEKGKNGGRVANSSDDDESSDKEKELLEAQLDHEKDMLEQKQEHELRVANLQATSDTVERIHSLDLGGESPTPETIAKQLEFCITTASSSLSETFDDIGWEKEREKFNQSEKVVNAAIKKAEIGVNKLRLCEPQDKALNYFNVYKEQVKEVKIKHIRRSYDMQIKQAKPETWIWFACIFFLPAILYPAFKTYTAMVALPKKRDIEISQIK